MTTIILTQINCMVIFNPSQENKLVINNGHQLKLKTIYDNYNIDLDKLFERDPQNKYRKDVK